jgi:hypothetical protein
MRARRFREQELEMANVLLVMGHRSANDEGDPEERRRTIFIVQAAERELRRAGHTVHVLQREDDDADDTFTHHPDGLTFVASRAADLIRRHNIQVMIDCHFQGSPTPTSGCFCIFPDGATLNPPAPEDSKAANPLDVKFAAKLAEEVSRQTTIPRLRLEEPGFLGGMSETQTGIARSAKRWRLGMFNLTRSVREQCVRVVMEHGDIIADLPVIDGPGYYDRVATAYVRAVNAFWPVGPVVEDFFAFEPREFTAFAGAVGRKHASTDSEIIRQYQGGDAIRCIGYYESQEVAGDNRWLRSAGPNAPRIHCSGVIEAVPQGTRTAPPTEAASPNGARGLSSEERLAQAERARRGPFPESAAVMEPAVLGCSALTSVAQAEEVAESALAGS